MGSTFNGLEVAKRSLATQQSALYTTGHNIANANTEGFTRQRVNFEATAPFPPASRNRSEIPGQVGSGVQAGSIERVREGFLDLQYRGENSKLGYYEAKTSAMQQMEGIMHEPSEQGLAKTMDRFWQALQDLSVNPENSGARSVVRQRGVAVAETFNYLSKSLEGIQNDLRKEMDITKDDINSLTRQIHNVNEQIATIEPHGYLPNDLYDERDRLIDRLSGMVEIKVEYPSTNEKQNPMAAGPATVTLVGNDNITLVDGTKREYAQVSIGVDENNAVNQFSFTSSAGAVTTVAAADFNSQGKLKALMESHGYVSGNGTAGAYPEMLEKLDTMAFAFATAFNTVHQSGTDLKEAGGVAFFDIGGEEAGTAGRLKVSDAIQESTDTIAASESGDVGDGENAKALAATMRNPITINGTTTSVKDFYESAIGEMAVMTQETGRLSSNATILRQQVEENRQSVSGVSLDEEMTNMIKFQHAYNAAARNMTQVDEMLDRIINNMGLVGR